MNEQDIEKKFWRASKLDYPCARMAVEKILGCEVTAEQTINYALKVLEDNYQKELENRGRKNPATAQLVAAFLTAEDRVAELEKQVEWYKDVDR